MSDYTKFEHDMKNLLGIILGYSSILIGEMRPEDPHLPDLEKIAEATDDALKLLATWAASLGGGA